MKKSLIALAAMGAFAGAAQAQSSVTLYGVVDANIEYVNNVGVVPTAANGFNRGPAHSVARMDPGGLSGSRWGLRGTEDLGGGLKALFVLESGFSSDTGASSKAAGSLDASPSWVCKATALGSSPSAASMSRCSTPWPTSRRLPTPPSTNPSCCSKVRTTAKTTLSSTPASLAPSPRAPTGRSGLA